MEATTGEHLNSTKASELIRDQTGKRCSRQNLEKLCKQGRLPHSCISISPIRLDAALLISEYLQQVDPRQQAGSKRQLRAAAEFADMEMPELPAGGVPDLNQERALHEREKRLIATMQRRQLEGELVYRCDMEQATHAVAAALNNQLEALPRQVRQQIPHLTLEEVQIIEGLVHQLRQAVADWELPTSEEQP